ncbi:MAG: VRR-NUC domain-containing protein [Proteobacteria bacterium]|nr:VRR-NUC domain-containing protein [Pseudomonadota bacterium]
MPPERPEELPEGYYLDNFEFLLRFVLERYERLLTTPELDLAHSFLAAPLASRRLYVRMANRRGEYFRVDKLHYPEISNIPAVIEELSSRGLVQQEVPDQETGISLCTRAELLQLTSLSACPKTARRVELVESLLNSSVDASPTDELGIATVRVTGMEHLQVFRLLFFGNFHQDMTEFVLHELVSPFESYDLSESSRLFRDREMVEEILRLKACAELAYDRLEVDESGDQLVELLGELTVRPTGHLPARRFDRIVNRLARQLERLGRYDSALQAYRLTRSAPSRERQVRLLATADDVQSALALCREIHADPSDEDEWEFAVRFAMRLARKHGCENPVPEDPDWQPIIKDSVVIAPQHDRVELAALAWFTAQGWEGWYVENALFRGLFGLAFWDIIFAPVPGAFFHPFQRGPEDLYTPDFIARRRDLIDNRLAELTDAELLANRVLSCFEEKHGVNNALVHWGWLDRSMIETSLAHLPARHLGLIFRRLLSDLKNNSTGLPDLILFHDDEYRLVEIKGPGDKLQKNQARWFRYFHQQGIPAEVIDVSYSR